MEKSNKMVRFHAFQSLLLTAAYIVGIFAISIVAGVISQVSGVLGGLIGMLPLIIIIAFLGLMVYGCIKAYQGQGFKLPVIGDMADKWSN
jgi:uncharacterized membrane protein